MRLNEIEKYKQGYNSTNRINMINDRVFVSQDSDIQSIERTICGNQLD